AVAGRGLERRRQRAGRSQRPLQPLPALTPVARHPEAVGRRRQPGGGLPPVALAQAPVEGGAQVVELLLQPVVPARVATRVERRLRLLDQRHGPVAVTAAVDGPLPRRTQLLVGVLPDRLEK